MTTSLSLSLDRLRVGGEAFMEEISREHYLTLAGLKAEAELRPIYARHAAILGDDALAMVLEQFRGAADGSEERRSARLLLEWLAEARASRELAELDEREIAWESTATMRLADGRRMPYQRAVIEIANATDRAERLMVDAARSTLVKAELAPMKQERLERDRELMLALDLAGGYVETFEALSGVAVRPLVEQCRTFLRDTQAMWDEVYPEFVRRGLGIEPGEARRPDALALLRAREFDQFFPAATMEETIRRQVGEMGADASAGGRVRFDTGEREGKRPRAFCAPVRVPDEVYLVLRPHGGQTDYNTFLHELGHALHFANMRADHPFEFRWLGDNSVTEGFAMLFDHLMQDRGWLLRYTALGKSNVERFLRSAGFEELHFLRRYSGKLIYEEQLYDGALPWSAVPDLYVDTLSSATGFRYDPADAFVDVDARFYAARYLRAWQLQSLVTRTLVERFDEDWWRNPRAGPYIVGDLFAEGQRELAQEQAARVAGGEALSFGPLVKSIERMLG